MAQKKAQKSREEIYQEVLDKLLLFASHKDRTKKEYLDAGARYLSRCKNSQQEKTEILEELITRLDELNLVDDAAYARAYLKEKLSFGKPIGRFAIKKFLYKKGVPNNVIQDVLEEYTYDLEFSQAQKLLKKRLATSENKVPAKLRQKTIAYLHTRGFSSDVIYAVIDTKLKTH